MLLAAAEIPFIYCTLVLFRGLDPDAYENFGSFCRQDYPEYEIIFCVGDAEDPALPVIERIGSGRVAANDKVAKLARMPGDAAYEHLVISDSDVRIRPDYLREVIAPTANPKIGAVTCRYGSLGDKSFIEDLQTVG